LKSLGFRMTAVEPSGFGTSRSAPTKSSSSIQSPSKLMNSQGTFYVELRGRGFSSKTGGGHSLHCGGSIRSAEAIHGLNRLLVERQCIQQRLNNKIFNDTFLYLESGAGERANRAEYLILFVPRWDRVLESKSKLHQIRR
jgi:hypothetical protein